MGGVGPTDSVPPIRSFRLDDYVITKLQFLQSPRLRGQVAVVTGHGLWHVDLSGEPTEAKPCKCLPAFDTND